ncbi:MAG: methyltransferase [Candidatus Caldatribacteriota bacterium]|nr:methyltransferase [Candidatus Caldatribacteriota bacterium]
MNPIIFKIIEFIILLVFAISISDFRMKKGMVPLINKKLILVLKLSYFVPICIYVYTLVILNNLLIFDFIALILTFFGTLLVVKAKIDIGEYHSWTGYQLHPTKITTKGIYSFIRHPLYTGIYIFIFGGLSTTIPHTPLYLLTIAIITLIYIMIFLAATAVRETKFLIKEFGEEFLKYQMQVHSFLPLKKFKS